jgi:hypothetical protein
MLIPGASEKIVYRFYTSVPRFDTDALAEKAKILKFNPVKGIRHIGPLASVEGVSIFVFLEIGRH